MSTETRQKFGCAVRLLRKERGVSLRQFALMVGIDKNHLVNIEHGRTSPTLDIIDKIACGLGVTLVRLFEVVRDTDPEQEPAIPAGKSVYRAMHVPD